MSVLGSVEAATWGGQWKRPPSVPENWYLLAPSAKVRPGAVLSTSVGGTEIVLMRSPAKTLTAYAAHCAHMGCHLRHAEVEAQGLRCALHRRLIRADGVFQDPEGRGAHRLTQQTYTVLE